MVIQKIKSPEPDSDFRILEISDQFFYFKVYTNIFRGADSSLK